MDETATFINADINLMCFQSRTACTSIVRIRDHPKHHLLVQTHLINLSSDCNDDASMKQRHSDFWKNHDYV